MTKKAEVNLNVYGKNARRLAEPMIQALSPGGGLNPVLQAVIHDDHLRLDIRDRRFNVYYAGGSLLKVDGKKRQWGMRCDPKYFKSSVPATLGLPTAFSGVKDSQKWVTAFPDLKTGMNDWWRKHHRDERKHCQAIAAANSGAMGTPVGDFLVLDLEYQYAQRRFDLIAARRRPTDFDMSGWSEPDLIFVEVKSDYAACSGKAGLGIHAQDYLDIIKARKGIAASEIKAEFQNVVAQKQRLGLLSNAIRFVSFSAAPPELLIVFVKIDPQHSSIRGHIQDVVKIAKPHVGNIGIGALSLNSPNYAMFSSAVTSLV